MKTLILLIFSLFLSSAIAQRGGGGRGHNNNGRPVKVVHKHRHQKKVVVVRHRSPYRPRHVVVYRPAWGPNYAYNHRWVYFPKRNLYWDNWRNHWVYFNGTLWISQPATPPGVREEEIRTDRHKELHEDNDDVDDVYKDNSVHQKDTVQ